MKIYFKGVKNISEVSFTTFEEILSYPGLLLGLKLLKASFTSSSVRFASHPWRFDVGLDTGQILFAINESLWLVLDQCLQRTYWSSLLFFLDQIFAIFSWSNISWPSTIILLGKLPLVDFAFPITSWITSHDFFISFW